MLGGWLGCWPELVTVARATMLARATPLDRATAAPLAKA